MPGQHIYNNILTNSISLRMSHKYKHEPTNKHNTHSQNITPGEPLIVLVYKVSQQTFLEWFFFDIYFYNTVKSGIFKQIGPHEYILYAKVCANQSSNIKTNK